MGSIVIKTALLSEAVADRGLACRGAEAETSSDSVREWVVEGVERVRRCDIGMDLFVERGVGDADLDSVRRLAPVERNRKPVGFPACELPPVVDGGATHDPTSFDQLTAWWRDRPPRP